MPIPFRPNIAAMAGYVPGEQPPAGARLIKLNTNENPYPPSPRVADAIRAELAEPGADEGLRLRLYSDPAATRVCQAAAERAGVDRAQVLAGNGSDELLSVLMRAFAGEGDTVAFPYPTYSLYRTMAEIQGATVETVDFPADYALPEALFGHSAKLVLIANPNSPSGTMCSNDDLARLAESLPNGVVVVDEAYGAFAGESALELIDSHDNLVVVQTLSKSHSLAGMRVGLLFGSAEMVAGLSKVKDSYSLDRLAIAAGAAAIADHAWVSANLERIRATRTRLVAGLAKLAMPSLPSQANFVFVRLGSAERARAAYQHLREHDILVRYFDRRLLADGLRITVGTDDEIDALLAALTEFASS